MPTTWKHDDLQHDLAESRRGTGELVAEKLGLGSYGGDAQLDVATMKPSWTQPNPTAYEIKVSRSDFHADTQVGKYRKYLPYLRRLYFAAPAGLLSKDEVPQGTGLIVRGENGWSVVRAPRVLQPEADKWPVFLQAMLMKGHPGPWARPSREARIAEALGSRSAGASLRFRGLELSRGILEAFAKAEEWRLHHDRLVFRVARALDEQPRERDLDELVELVLARRPAAPGPDLRMLRYAIDGSITSLQRALRQLETLEQKDAA